jgi:hypothetical protein
MGIFDIFKTKITGAADKAGDVAGDVAGKVGDAVEDLKEKVTDTVHKKDEGPAPTADAAAPVVEGEHNAEEMVSEGSPVAEAPAAPEESGQGGGMMGTIKQNVAGGAEKAGSFVDDKTGGKFSDQIDKGVEATKKAMGQG